jgi:hypothetical protein
VTTGRKALFRLMTIALSAGVALVAGEIAARLFWKDNPNFAPDERTLSYQYDAELGWFPVPNSTAVFTGSRLIHIQHNADGFRDQSHGAKTRPRIAFLGDSFVWGYDVEDGERFTELLQARLPGWEVLNLGVSGYGTDQEFILLQRWFDRYQPDVVVLVLSDDDLFTNAHNEFLYSYYKPYFEEVDGQLVEHGVPVPKSIRYYCREHPLLFRSRLAQLLFARYLRWRAPFYACPNNPTLPILLAMKNYAQAKGARFAMGFVTDVQADGKRAFCAAGKIDSLFLLEAPFQKWDYIYPTLGNHWTPRGHQLVSDVLYSFLLTNKFVTQP